MSQNLAYLETMLPQFKGNLSSIFHVKNVSGVQRS